MSSFAPGSCKLTVAFLGDLLLFPFARAVTWFYNLSCYDINDMDENPLILQKKMPVQTIHGIVL